MRILLGNRFGKIIEEVQPDVGSVSWILDGIGQVVLTFAKSDSKATASNLQVGNRVYIEMDHGLPAWGGTIEVPRKWTAGTVSVSCYGIEYQLSSRVTRKNDIFNDRLAGSIFSDLLLHEEQKDPLGIVLGKVWMGGRLHRLSYHYKPVWQVLTDGLRKYEQCDFRFTPLLDGNTIQFRADLGQILGEDRTTAVALVEGSGAGCNVSGDLTLEEQGAVINVQYTAGSGSSWGDDRTVVVAKDSNSAARHGLREKQATYSGIADVATLQMLAERALSQNSEPRRIFSLPVLDAEPGRFSAYGLGDVVRAVLSTYGFGGYDGKLRVLAREFDPSSGGCKLVVEEQNEIVPWIYTDETGGA